MASLVHILDLPEPTLLLILYASSPLDRIALSRTCMRLHTLCTDPRMQVTVDPDYHQPQPSTSHPTPLRDSSARHPGHPHRRRSSIERSRILHRDRPEFSGRCFATLAEAVAASKAGETIRLAPGVHTIDATIQITCPLRIVGVGEDGATDRAEPAVLQGCKRLSPVLDVRAAAILEGLSIHAREGTVRLLLVLCNVWM